MKLYLRNNHIVVNLDGDYYIVDTGSPISFNYRAQPEIEIYGYGFPFNSMIGCSKEIADSLTEMDISGFIGLDILRKTDLSISFTDGSIFFNLAFLDDPHAEYTCIPFEYFRNTYIVTSSLFLGSPLNNAIIDSGARISYLSPRILPLLECTNEGYIDNSPEYGVLEGHYYCGKLKSTVTNSRLDRRVKVGQLPPVLDVFGLFDAIIGITDLTDGRIIFDFGKQIIYLS